VTQLFMTRPAGAGELPVPALPDGVVERAAVAADADALAALLAEAFDEAWDADRVRRDLLEAPDVAVTHLLEEDGRLVGTASERVMDLYPGAGYVHWVGVPPAARGRRLGSILTALCVAGFARRGLPVAVLETDDFREAAVLSYLRLGFVPEYRSETERTAWSALMPRLLAGRPRGGAQ